MNQSQPTQEQKDEMLWRIAKKRASFRKSLASYLVINAFLTAVWYFTAQTYFWPIWCMFGWGIGILFQYADAYHDNHAFSTQKEYEKLVNENK